MSFDENAHAPEVSAFDAAVDGDGHEVRTYGSVEHVLVSKGVAFVGKVAARSGFVLLRGFVDAAGPVVVARRVDAVAAHTQVSAALVVDTSSDS